MIEERNQGKLVMVSVDTIFSLLLRCMKYIDYYVQVKPLEISVVRYDLCRQKELSLYILCIL